MVFGCGVKVFAVGAHEVVYGLVVVVGVSVVNSLPGSYVYFVNLVGIASESADCLPSGPGTSRRNAVSGLTGGPPMTFLSAAGPFVLSQRCRFRTCALCLVSFCAASRSCFW